MSTLNSPDYKLAEVPDASAFKFGVVVSEWNNSITNALKKGCLDTLKTKGVEEENIHVIEVPGSFELPAGANMLVRSRKVDAVICLGCVIKGETRHDEYINNAVSLGLMQLSVGHNRPFIFGVLTTEDEAQARERSGGKHGNKGIEAAITAIKMLVLQKELKEPVG